MPSSPTPTWAPELLARAYYSDDSVVLIHGDCLEHPEWWTGADVLVTDPPYGIKYRSRAAIDYSRRLESQPLSNDTDTAVRDLVVIMWGDERPAIVFGSWRVPKPENVLSTLIWDKGEQNGLGSMHLPWSPTHEEIYVMGQTVARGGSPKGWKQNGRHPRRGSVIKNRECLSNPHGLVATIGHPTPKPLGLMEHLIDRCPSGTIADPCAGSGSTLVAAKLLGRRAVGVELEEKYCEIAARRLSQGVLDLWGGEEA